MPANGVENPFLQMLQKCKPKCFVEKYNFTYFERKAKYFREVVLPVS